MPRPTAAQLAYGSCTVIFSTLAMLLLSETGSGLGVAVIAVAALALGLLVAMTVPLPRSRPATSQAEPTATPDTALVPAPRKPVAATSEPVREPTAS
ncbi:hypothetical protein ACGFYV_24160 [Streptomyces sp. NPDC048297]|uniref:hypothetical protein n=1 Tax=Streptomyces sp. NPDC048297 TaxID=3365531 RepID=UPI0037107D98